MFACSNYSFNISDPKPRNIHKATVRDRLLHHAIYRILYPFFDKVFISDSYSCREILLKVREFLQAELKLELHPNKVTIETLASGVDFLGWVNFPDHRVLRTTTKKRMFRNIKDGGGKLEVIQSYLGLLSHGDGRNLEEEIIGHL